MSFFDGIFGSKGNSAGKETRLSYSLDTKNGRDGLMMEFLKIKGIESLNELPDEQFIRIFGDEKYRVIDRYLSGVGGTENYCVAMAIISHKLRKKHGDLEEVHCLEGPIIELQYQNRHNITIKEHSGNLDLTLIKFGYLGTGPDCFCAFLNENGFKLSKDDIAQIKTPFLIKSGQKSSSNDEALNIKPNDYAAWYGRGQELYSKGLFEDALKSYDKALNINPKSAEAWYGRGNSLFFLNRSNESVKSYDKALKVNPDFSEAWANRGRALSLIGINTKNARSYDEALKSFDRALKINPEYSYAWKHRGVMFSWLGFDNKNYKSYESAIKPYNEAIKSFDRALAIKFDDDEAWYLRGNVLYELMRYDDAIASFDKALEINPEHSGAKKDREYAQRRKHN
jgi:Tfp pilus assembly protein PilF